MTRPLMCFAAAALAISVISAAPAQALTVQECSAKYRAAQTANSLNGMKWNDFRKAQCGSDAAAGPAAALAAASTAAKPAAAAPASAADATFPSAVAPKYATETAGKARMHTCLDQYNANKAGAGNGGLNWIAKGGGYYSECNKRLKG